MTIIIVRGEYSWKVYMLAWIFWDPSSEFLIVPFINIPITWYGLLFAFGFWIGFHLFTYMLKNKLGPKDANIFAERLLLYVIIGTIVGARLGHIFFYEHPMEYLSVSCSRAHLLLDGTAIRMDALALARK